MCIKANKVSKKEQRLFIGSNVTKETEVFTSEKIEEEGKVAMAKMIIFQRLSSLVAKMKRIHKTVNLNSKNPTFSIYKNLPRCGGPLFFIP